MGIKRVNMNVPEELLKRLDDYASSNYQTRSSVMCQACDQYLNAKQMQKMFASMTETFERLSKADSLDDETRKQIDELEKVSRLLAGSLGQVG